LRLVSLPCAPGWHAACSQESQEVVMNAIRENLFPVTVIFCWMISSAYTIFLIA
jgi:hypothetical protein